METFFLSQKRRCVLRIWKFGIFLLCCSLFALPGCGKAEEEIDHVLETTDEINNETDEAINDDNTEGETE